MIKLIGVSKYFGQTQVLKNLSFNVATGHTTALLGLSGSGKTTALKLICGLTSANEGQIFLDQDEVTPNNLFKVRKKIGYVIQDGGLFPHLTGYKNISIVAEEAGWESNKIKNRINELGEITKMQKNLLQNYPRQLSGGQKQRLGIMRALILDPPVLLLDEPMGALDPITRSDLHQEFKELFKKLNKTVLLVTHNLLEAGHLAENILLLNRGQIEQSGSMQNLINQPASDFVRKFVGSQL